MHINEYLYITLEKIDIFIMLIDSSNPRTLYASHLFISSLMSFMSLCSVQPISPVHVLVRFTPEYLVFEQLK